MLSLRECSSLPSLLQSSSFCPLLPHSLQHRLPAVATLAPWPPSSLPPGGQPSPRDLRVSKLTRSTLSPAVSVGSERQCITQEPSIVLPFPEWITLPF